MQSVDDLREQLKNLGYLSYGIERWFALDPWSSRTFWSELLLLAVKSATACCAFVAAPFILITIWKNLPLGGIDIGWIVGLYLAVSFAVIFALVLAGALLFKVRPSLGIESQRFLTTFSMVMAGLLAAASGFWWSGFRETATLPQLAIGSALILVAFLVNSTVFAAALLSFSIHETRQIPAIRRRSRRGPLAAGGVLLIVALTISLALQGEGEETEAPAQIVLSGSPVRVAVLGVDGLTRELFDSRQDLRTALPHSSPLFSSVDGSAPERWATIGTGTPARLHGVRAVAGLRFRGSGRILQSISDRDPVMKHVAPILRAAIRQPLPPTVRKRDLVWEITSSRSIPSVAVNWWSASSNRSPTLVSVPQEEVFTLASREANGPMETARLIDQIAGERLIELAVRDRPAMAAVYLPAMDIVLNRIDADTTSKLTASVEILDRLSQDVRLLRQNGFHVLLAGLPGEGQEGEGVIGSTWPLPAEVNAEDIAPTLLDLAGFPASREMPGRSFRPGSSQQRISSYGARREEGTAPSVDEEYYRSLRSLGYIQ